MNILLTQHECGLKDQFFPQDFLDELSKFGNLRVNDKGRTFTHEELKEYVKDIDICMTHCWWGCPKFDEEVIENANRLKLIVHPAASVASFITDCVYDRGIKVCSANSVMARYVAEGTLAYILSAIRQVPQHDKFMKQKQWKQLKRSTLINARVGLVGLGTVGRFLLDFLKPFQVEVRIYDPYLSAQALMQYDNVRLCSLEEVISWADVVSVHASRTPETYHMLNSERLGLMKDGAVLINTARGALMDEAALAAELKTGRISAVLDVYDPEPPKPDNPLYELDNVLLMPHVAGGDFSKEYSLAMLEEIKRFIKGEALLYEIPYEQFNRMTR